MKDDCKSRKRPILIRLKQKIFFMFVGPLWLWLSMVCRIKTLMVFIRRRRRYPLPRCVQVRPKLNEKAKKHTWPFHQMVDKGLFLVSFVILLRPSPIFNWNFWLNLTVDVYESLPLANTELIHQLKTVKKLPGCGGRAVQFANLLSFQSCSRSRVRTRVLPFFFANLLAIKIAGSSSKNNSMWNYDRVETRNLNCRQVECNQSTDALSIIYKLKPYSCGSFVRGKLLCSPSEDWPMKKIAQHK